VQRPPKRFKSVINPLGELPMGAEIRSGSSVVFFPGITIRPDLGNIFIRRTVILDTQYPPEPITDNGFIAQPEYLLLVLFKPFRIKR